MGCMAGLLTYSCVSCLPDKIAVSGFAVETHIGELTAAGLSGIFTRFPFHPIFPERKYETNATQR